MTDPQDPFQPPGPAPEPAHQGWNAPPPGYGPPPPGYGPPAGYGPPGYQQWGPPQRKTNGLAIASLCCGIVGCLYGVPAILAIVFGFVARSQIKQQPQEGGGMALAGIILGFAWILVGVVAIIFVVAFGTSSGSSCYDSGPYSSC